MHRPYHRSALIIAALLLACIQAACPDHDRADATDERSSPMTIRMASTAFTEGQPIPSKHTCDAENLSPQLSWDSVPAGTKSLALICDDPDAPAGTWVHWVLYDLPETTRAIPAGLETKEVVAGGAKQGRNDFGRIGYGGPCPPRGGPHRYYFKLYALDSALNLKSGATKGDVEKAMKGHVLGEGKIMGTYRRA